MNECYVCKKNNAFLTLDTGVRTINVCKECADRMHNTLKVFYLHREIRRVKKR
jgi:hypothetical protein